MCGIWDTHTDLWIWDQICDIYVCYRWYICDLFICDICAIYVWYRWYMWNKLVIYVWCVSSTCMYTHIIKCVTYVLYISDMLVTYLWYTWNFLWYLSMVWVYVYLHVRFRSDILVICLWYMFNIFNGFYRGFYKCLPIS